MLAKARLERAQAALVSFLEAAAGVGLLGILNGDKNVEGPREHGGTALVEEDSSERRPLALRAQLRRVSREGCEVRDPGPSDSTIRIRRDTPGCSPVGGGHCVWDG
ncbi:unnamed protein product [Agarophyton chilense]